MLNKQQEREYYRAFVERDSRYEGVFFAGITSTGIFCRPTCKARTPKFENCEFFKTAQESLLAGFRPCKRCHPLLSPNEPSKMVKSLLEAVEQDPTKRWQDQDVRDLGFDPTTARRQFKSRYGMTFVAYARARRMGVALKTIRSGDKIINAQLDAGYESSSGFRDAFANIMGTAPNKKESQALYADWLETPLGSMIAMGDETHLYLLEFVDRRGLEREIEKMRTRLKSSILPGQTPPLSHLKQELEAYFAGELKEFSVPLKLIGSEFQNSVWQQLMTIPYGQTRSYKQQAEILNNPKGVRAVARANGMNQMAIIIPCHRVIGADGSLTGYAGGLQRKQWLLDHEAGAHPFI